MHTVFGELTSFYKRLDCLDYGMGMIFASRGTDGRFVTNIKPHL